MTKQTWGVIVLIIVILAGVWYYQGKKPEPAAGEPIKIGFVGPLTGNLATYGTGAKEGLELGLEQLAVAGVKGRPIQIIFEDTGGEVKNAVSAAQKLINVDNVSAILSGGPSQEAVALIPVAETAKVPMLTLESQAPELTTGGDYVFRFIPEMTLLANDLVKFANNKGYKKAAILTANYNQATVAAAEKFKEEFKKLGGQVVIDERFGPGTKEFKSELQKIKLSGADFLFLNALTSEAGIIIKQKSEVGLTLPIISQSGVEDKKIIDLGGVSSEGIIFATFNATPSDDFVNQVKNKFNFEPRRWNIEGYEAVKFLLLALDKAPSFDPEGVKQGFAAVRSLEGLSGELVFDEEGNIIRPVIFKVITNGQFEELK